MATDYLGDFKTKKNQSRFNSVEEARSFLIEKERQKKIKSVALKQINTLKKRAALQRAYGSASNIVEEAQFQAQQAKIGQKREGIIRSMGSRAERIEQWAASLNEVPMLRNMEKARANILTPNNSWLQNVEKSATDSMPD